MNLAEKLVSAYLNNEVVPLKGKTTIELTNVRTGKRERIESENMVTNAVSNILAHNYCGIANFNSLTPLKNMFGGVLLFKDNITENADNYNIPNDTNTCFAWAGDEAHATANPYRGNPNGGETIETDNSIAFVWDWMTNQGNTGEDGITCVCLTHAKFGNMGTKPWDATINPMSAFGALTVGTRTITDEVRKEFPVAFGSDGRSYYAVNLNGTSFKEFTMSHDLWKFGILKTASDWTQTASREATLDAGSNKFFFLDDTYYYVAWVTSATAMTIKKISRSDFTVTDASITVSDVALYQGELDAVQYLPLFAFDGTYLYFPNDDATKLIKIDIAVPANTDYLEGTGSINIKGAPAGTAGFQRMTPITVSTGFVVGDNYVVNNDHMYPILGVSGIGATIDYYNRNCWLDVVRHGASCYGHAIGSQDSRQYGQSNVLFPYYLATINNLTGDPVQKGSAQTMKVRYTLTEV